MNRIRALLCFLAVATVADTSRAQVDLTVSPDGQIVLLGKGIDLVGVDLISSGGYLVPPNEDDPDPFAFFLENTSSQVTYGVLGTSVPLDGELPLSAYYQVSENVDISQDLAQSQWGGLGDGNQGPIGFPLPPTPEPGAGSLAVLGLAYLFGMTRRRHRE